VSAETGTETTQESAPARWWNRPWFAPLLIVASVFATTGNPPPFENENAYLVWPRVVFEPSYLKGDWSFSGTNYEHWIFNHLIGPVSEYVQLPVFAWIGRLACWITLAYLVLSVAERLHVPRVRAAIAVSIWVFAFWQTTIGGEWAFGTFEAKSIAYICLFGSLALALRPVSKRNILWAGVLVGLSISFHPGVGLYAIPAVLGALVLQPATRRLAFLAVPGTVLAALPGIIFGLKAQQGSATSAANTEWLVKRGFPSFMDPAQFGVWHIGLFLVTLAIVLWVTWQRRDDRATLTIGLVCLLLTIPVLIGFAARLVGAYSFLTLFPFRVGPVLISLFAVVYVVRVSPEPRQARAWLTSVAESKVNIALIAIAALFFLGTNPVYAAAFQVGRNGRDWVFPPTQQNNAMDWVRDHTPKSALVLISPSIYSSFITMQRREVTTYNVTRYDDIAGWRDRLISLLGEHYVDDAPDWINRGNMNKQFESRTQAEIEHAARQYGASYLVTETKYLFPTVYSDGSWKVYRLPSNK
jgi:hypothetical protein